MGAMREAGDYSGNFSGKVLNNVDPSGEAQVGVWIPDLQPQNDGSSKEPYKIPSSDTSDLLDNDEDFKGTNKLHEANSYIWCRPAGNGDGEFSVPRVGQWVTVYFENEDPSKGYYGRGAPTSNKQMTPGANIGKSDALPNTAGNWANPTSRVNIHVIKELGNGNIMFFDGNQNSNAFVVRFASGHEVLIQDAAETGIRLKSGGGHIVHLDDKAKQIKITTQTGQVAVVLDDSDGKSKQTQTGPNELKAKSQKTEVDANAELTAGGEINYKGSIINLN